MQGHPKTETTKLGRADRRASPVGGTVCLGTKVPNSASAPHRRISRYSTVVQYIKVHSPTLTPYLTFILPHLPLLNPAECIHCKGLGCKTSPLSPAQQ